MYLNVHGELYEVNGDNAIYFTGETLIEGLYVDYDEEYLFIPTEAVGEPECLFDVIDSEGLTVVELMEYDPDEEPFRFIINALCRYFNREIEYLDEN